MKHSPKQWNTLAVCTCAGLLSIVACKQDAPQPQPQPQTQPAPQVNNYNQYPNTNPSAATNRKPNVGTVTDTPPVVFAPGSMPLIRFHAQDPDTGDSIARITLRTMPAEALDPVTGQVNTVGTEQTIRPIIPAQPKLASAVGVIEVCDTRGACAETQFPILFQTQGTQPANTSPSGMNTFCQAMIPVMGTIVQGQQGTTTSSTTTDATGNTTTTQTTTTQPSLAQALMTLGCTLVK